MVIYGDILLAVNWWVDFLLLMLVRRLTGAGTGGVRVALGGLVGALSCAVISGITYLIASAIERAKASR